MALTGLDIYKHLPKTNCGKCGSPTCLAFAMKLAAKKAALEECPTVSEGAKQALAAASEPPIRTVTLGSPENKLEVGGETVLYRHDKTFYHPTGLGVLIADNLPSAELDANLKGFNRLVFDRVGQQVRTEIIALKNSSGKKEDFLAALNKILSQTKAVLILISENIETLEEALKLTAISRPLIYAAKAGNYEAMAGLAKKYNTALAVRGKDLDELAILAQKISALGVKDLILDTPERDGAKVLSTLTQIRRLALKKNFRPLGYPALTFTEGADIAEDAALAAGYIIKYAGIVIVTGLESYEHLPLVAIRQNIYTDPQKPVAVEAKLYTIGGTPNEKSPVLVTTNFSLTYFTVEPEIINSKIPCYLIVADAEGMSVLTAWAAEKFSAETVWATMQKFEIDKKVAHRKIIIPGYVTVMSGKLADLSGWEVLVGPREASGLPAYLKNLSA
ncbi:MAG: acetyl-CoA decarbonylase/synthase complex subunit gamma [Elusimicrobiota bacterium]